MAKKLPLIHPGEILREEFLVPLKLTPVAAALHVPRTRIERIAREEKPVRPTPRCDSASSSDRCSVLDETFRRVTISKRPKMCSGSRSRGLCATRRRESYVH
jgi:hypothetical protein